MLRNSLRFRIIAAFCLFCTISGLTYVSYILIIQLSSEDAIFNNRISIEIEGFLNSYELDKNTPLFKSAYLKGYIGKEEIPVSEQILVDGKGDGIYEELDLDYHIGISSLPGTDLKLYMIYYVGDLEIHDERMLKTGKVMIVSFVFFLILALIFSFIISNKVIDPVIQLANIIKKSKPEKPETDFSRDFYNDEVGFLANTLEHYLIRMNQYIETEKNFAMDVSHELRTPVTSVKGAVDVIRRSPEFEQSFVQKPLDRIDRAVRDMENSIETFLTLSQIEEKLPVEKSFFVKPVIQDILDQNQYLLIKKDVKVVVKDENDVQITTAPGVFKIVASNLVRNAFQYTRAGTITIEIGNNNIKISDTGIGIPDQELHQVTELFAKSELSKGFGIGLSIVQRLCDRAGWKLKIQSDSGKGTQVILSYTKI